MRFFRKITTVTIDPENAKDFDDALSFRKLSNGNYEVGVHIADVSYFVKQNTPVDLDAQKRTTSYYLPYRVLKMLPKILTETLCSLNPGVERYAYTVF